MSDHKTGNDRLGPKLSSTPYPKTIRRHSSHFWRHQTTTMTTTLTLEDGAQRLKRDEAKVRWHSTVADSFLKAKKNLTKEKNPKNIPVVY